MAFLTPVLGKSVFLAGQARLAKVNVRPERRAIEKVVRRAATLRASIEEEVGAALKDAMRAKDAERLKALRAIRASFLTALKSEGAGDKLSDKEAIASLRKLAKMRQESIDMFQKGGRDDLVQAETNELNVINQWLPTLASSEQMHTWAQEAVDKTGASKPGDMGKVMG